MDDVPPPTGPSHTVGTKWGTVFRETPSQEKDPRGRVAIRHPFMALDQRLKETRDYVDAIIQPVPYALALRCFGSLAL
jgi:hypothetical protein